MYYDIRVRGDWHIDVAKEFKRFLNKQGYRADISDKKFKTHEKEVEPKKIIYITADEGKSYGIICFKDHLSSRMNFVVRDVAPDPACKIILKSQYRRDYYEIDKIKPYTYFSKDPALFDEHVDIWRGLRKTNKTHMHFRGASWQNRKETLNHMSELVPKLEGKLKIKDYYKECAEWLYGISLPGYGNCCHREIEYFGLGTCVIMPKLKNSYHNPLIPNYHYVSADVNTTKDKANVVAQGLREAFHEIKKDRDLTYFIIKNAKEWYDTNVRLPNSVELASRIMS